MIDIDFRTANVYGIYGGLGSGKTLTAVEIALEFLRLGFTVSSNIDIKVPSGFSGTFNFFPDFELVDYWKLPQGAPRGSDSDFRAAVIIDEVAEFFDQNSFKSPLTVRFTSWLRQSSKRGQFVFIICQHPDFMAKALRKLTHRWIRCVDLAQVKIPVLCIRPPFLSSFCCRFVFDNLGNKISHGLCLVWKYSIAPYYNTSQIISREGRNTSSPSFRPPSFYTLCFWLSILYLFVIYYWF